MPPGAAPRPSVPLAHSLRFPLKRKIPSLARPQDPRTRRPGRRPSSRTREPHVKRIAGIPSIKFDGRSRSDSRPGGQDITRRAFAATRNSRADSAQEIPSSPHPSRAKLSFSASRKTFALPNLSARRQRHRPTMPDEPVRGPGALLPANRGTPERCSPAVAGPPELRSPQTSWGPPESTPPP